MTLETFSKKFDQFADAPNAVAKMRELVLHLAVTGKLVPQDPNDEPAKDLIRRASPRPRVFFSPPLLVSPLYALPYTTSQIPGQTPATFHVPLLNIGSPTNFD